ncbi:MAG: hypothetical protein CLLPBCKN_006163 [Chroococcidiopsis cubana SAG 39.79]|uniref:HTH cro/C1-type domain-containing protein n=1 Tax=Chroococcidiopsis cubana SAG 39.79 TaxID=388085 RepID=A0AB37UG62_9CYAN|nr:helix-turn-helix domain-containing protein [Chroococcidiopsis cubana]MDZ4876728.1 hypothetical protein [Chroococcidiopsis cubana SAG 39.79]PSB65943.1 transcriptional regulator [Chroococcidiopsis cubana CCALA 043]RUT10571.1 hypothetical protein DSM107010_41380 [Chroococcidiopsis cubana SAG 39.79]
MDIKVIRWKLNEVMARKRIRNKDLAKTLSITETSIYRLRKTDEMPRLSPERLNGICAALECQPGELLEWLPDDDGNQVANTNQTSLEPPNQKTDLASTQQTKPQDRNRSFLTVVAEVPESA